MKMTPDGSIISGYFQTTTSAMDSNSIYDKGVELMLGQIERIHFVDDSTNRSKLFVEYDVSATDAYGGQSTYKNVRSMSKIFGSNDFEETVLEANDVAFSGKLEKGNIFKNKNGTIVVLAFLNKSLDKPLILGALPHPLFDGSKKLDGINHRSIFRGLSTEINKDGELIITFNGSKTSEGLPLNPDLEPITIKLGKDGSIETGKGHKVLLSSTSGEENMSIIHKLGSIIQLDKNGSIVLVSSDGNYIFLNAKDGQLSIVQKSGHMFSMIENEITISHSNGKQIITLNDTKVQVTADEDVVVSVPKATLDAGSINLGNNAFFSSVIGENLASLFDLHNHGTAVGPSTPPLPPNTAALINAVPATAFLSSFIKIRGNI